MSKERDDSIMTEEGKVVIRKFLNKEYIVKNGNEYLSIPELEEKLNEIDPKNYKWTNYTHRLVWDFFFGIKEILEQFK